MRKSNMTSLTTAMMRCFVFLISSNLINILSSGQGFISVILSVNSFDNFFIKWILLTSCPEIEKTPVQILIYRMVDIAALNKSSKS